MPPSQTGSTVDFEPRVAERPRRSRAGLVTALVVSDAIAVFAADLLATWLRFGSMTARVAFENTTLSVSFWQLAIIVVPLWVLMLAISGLYDADSVTWGLSVTGRVARTLSLGVVALILLTYIAKVPGLSRAWTLVFWICGIVLVLVSRGFVALFVSWRRHNGHDLQPTLVVGSNSEAADIIRVLRGDPSGGLIPVACLTSSQAERLELDWVSDGIPVLGHARELVEIVARTNIGAVIIVSTAFDHDVLARMIAELRESKLDVHISSGLFEVLTSRVLVTEVSGVPLITVRGISLSKTNLLTKRTFDLVVSLLVLLVGLPVWALIALAIKITNPGPILYSQTRVGRDGTPFEMFKFRSMYLDAETRLADVLSANEASGPLFKVKNDPRVTPVGRWLRKFSIDEVPQILNVLRGEMSLVGPRPPLPREVVEYSSHHWRRLEVVPGMTGLWQVSGRSSLTFEEMVRLDLFYIENWSVGLDMTLIFRTIPAVLFARGAY